MTISGSRLLVCALCLLAAPVAAYAQSSTCSFTQSADVMLLTSDCVTDHTIEIPDGYTLDGAGFEIAAVEAGGRPFLGAVVMARGATASIVNTTVTAVGLSGGCPSGENRLRGIYFDGASGDISGNTVTAIFRGPLACDEGIAIEVRTLPATGTLSQVTIRGNAVDAYQKGGILVHGNVDAVIEANAIGSSVSDGRVGVNGIQVGPLAGARIARNSIEGVFSGHVTAGAAVLLFETAAGTVVHDNRIVSAADVGIHVLASGVTVSSNVVDDRGPDGLYDVGIVNRGTNNLFFGNAVRGFQNRSLGVEIEPAGGGQQVE